MPEWEGIPVICFWTGSPLHIFLSAPLSVSIFSSCCCLFVYVYHLSLLLLLCLCLCSLFAAYQFDINPSEREARPHFAQHCSQTFLQQNSFSLLPQFCGLTIKHPAIFGSRWMSGPMRTKPAKRSWKRKLCCLAPGLLLRSFPSTWASRTDNNEIKPPKEWPTKKSGKFGCFSFISLQCVSKGSV